MGRLALSLHHGSDSGCHSSRAVLSLRFTIVIAAFISRITAQAVQNVTFQNTATELIYIPALCDVGVVDDIPTNCAGSWVTVDLPGSSNGTVTSTDGPDEQFGNILPQVYFTFRGSALFVKTSDVSNATANLTVSFMPSGLLLSRIFDPSKTFWSFEDLDESQTATLAVTFLSNSSSPGTRLDIDFVKISVSNSSATSSFLPSQTILTSIFTPTSTVIVTASTRHSRRQPVGTIVGETLAAVFGVAGLMFVAFVLLRLRKWKNRLEERRKRTMKVQAASQIMAQQPQPLRTSIDPRTMQTPPMMQYSGSGLSPAQWQDTAHSLTLSSGRLAELGH